MFKDLGPFEKPLNTFGSFVHERTGKSIDYLGFGSNSLQDFLAMFSDVLDLDEKLGVVRSKTPSHPLSREGQLKTTTIPLK